MSDSKVIAAAYREQIEADIRQNNVEGALQNLLNLVKNLAPEYRNDVVALWRRETAYRANVMKGVADDAEINAIVSIILNISCEAEKFSIIPSEAVITAKSENANTVTTSIDDKKENKNTSEPGLQHIRDAYIPADSPLPAEEQQRRHWLRYSKVNDSNKFEVVNFINVSKAYKKGNFKLEGISLSLRLGEITGIAGKNGSGKTTLLGLIRRHLAQDAGIIKLPLLTMKGESLRRACEHIYYIRQDLRPWLGTLKTNLHLHAAAAGVYGEANKILIDELAFRYGLSRFYQASYSTLSGGYRLRYELVKALIARPKLLVLDEPLASLDLLSRQEFLENLRNIAYSLSEPMAIVLTTQNLYDLDAIADQTIILDDGRLVHADGHASNNAKLFEVISKAPPAIISSSLSSLLMRVVSSSIDCYVVKSLSDCSPSEDAIKIYETLGDLVTGVRNITQSARRHFV